MLSFHSNLLTSTSLILTLVLVVFFELYYGGVIKHQGNDKRSCIKGSALATMCRLRSWVNEI